MIYLTIRNGIIKEICTDINEFKRHLYHAHSSKDTKCVILNELYDASLIIRKIFRDKSFHNKLFNRMIYDYKPDVKKDFETMNSVHSRFSEPKIGLSDLMKYDDIICKKIIHINDFCKMIYTRKLMIN